MWQVVDGRGGAVEGGCVLFGPLPGAGMPSATGVAEGRYGNAQTRLAQLEEDSGRCPCRCGNGLVIRSVER